MFAFNLLAHSRKINYSSNTSVQYRRTYPVPIQNCLGIYFHIRYSS